MCALVDGFDYAYCLKLDLENILQPNIPIKVLTGSKSHFNVILQSTATQEKRLLIDLACIRAGYKTFERHKMAQVLSNQNRADAVTKITSGRRLDTVLSKGTLEHGMNI